MSFLDRLIAAVTPPESNEERVQARRDARAIAAPNGWFSAVLDQHEAIEAAFDRARTEQTSAGRIDVVRELAVLLTGHSNAEETLLYPEMADTGHKTHASMAYEEQAMTKVQLARLEKMDPLSQDYLDKLEHIRGAVTHHMYQEESDWFRELQTQISPERDLELAVRFRSEVERYVELGLSNRAAND